MLGPKLKKIYNDKGLTIIFSSTANLKSLLYNNKDPLLSRSCPGVYRLDCTCGKSYVGQTEKKVLTRSIEHQQQDAMAGRWSSSGATEYSKECHVYFNWLDLKTLTREYNFYHRRSIKHWKFSVTEMVQRRIWNQQRHREYIKTDSWRALFYTWKREQPNKR